MSGDVNEWPVAVQDGIEAAARACFDTITERPWPSSYQWEALAEDQRELWRGMAIAALAAAGYAALRAEVERLTAERDAALDDAAKRDALHKAITRFLDASEAVWGAEGSGQRTAATREWIIADAQLRAALEGQRA